jgi:CRISPR-associated protein Cmr4
VVDLPVAREVTTKWPYIPGSTIKGVVRDAAEGTPSLDTSLVVAAFGPRNGELTAGALAFGDAKLVCLPVRSWRGTFAWLTCPLALARLDRDYRGAGLAMTVPPAPAIGEEAIAVPTGSVLCDGDGPVYLEEFDFRPAGAAERAAADALAGALAPVLFPASGGVPDPWASLFVERFGVVSDDTFTFVAEHGTEIAPHIRLQEETKTVATGGFWYEEAVPAESVFVSLVIASGRNAAAASVGSVVKPAVANGLLQVGGHASGGRGLVRAIVEG